MSVIRLLDRVRNTIRALHYSRKTEQAYCYWIRFFIRFHRCRYSAMQDLNFTVTGCVPQPSPYDVFDRFGVFFQQVPGGDFHIVEQRLVTHQVGNTKLQHAGLPCSQHFAGTAQLQVLARDFETVICFT